MRLANSLKIQSGINDFIPTSLWYNRRLKLEAEKIAVAEKAFKVQKEKMVEGRRRVHDLELDTYWDELSPSEQVQAENICINIGYHEARKFVKKVGMRNYRQHRGC